MKIDNNGTVCERPSSNSSIGERLEYLRRKRENKLFRYQEIQQQWPSRYIRANLGKNHPDYGMSPQEHAKNKS